MKAFIMGIVSIVTAMFYLVRIFLKISVDRYQHDKLLNAKL